jgi:acyl carrier protein
MVPTREEVAARIVAAIRQSMQRDDLGEIGPATSLMTDLGIGSLDMATVIYELEEQYDIEIAPDVLFPQRVLRDPQYVVDSSITAAGVEKIRETLSFTTLPELPVGMSIHAVTNRLLTVGLLTDYVLFLIAAKQS